jgi:ribosomal subunit interface protein
MNLEIKSVGFSMSDEEKQFIDKKAERFRKSEEHLTDLIFSFTKEGPNIKAEAVVNFRWGLRGHVAETDHDFKAAADKLVDRLQVKITKEKEKAEEKRG